MFRVSVFTSSFPNTWKCEVFIFCLSSLQISCLITVEVALKKLEVYGEGLELQQLIDRNENRRQRI